MSIISEINSEFETHGSNSSFLLALSGGLDSTVLFHIMLKLDLDFSVAHANFGLRGKDSDEDEEFVKSLCRKFSIRCYTNNFNVLAHMSAHSSSLQMSARNLRYDWFYELIRKEKTDFIVTAHHLNDSMETFFINLIRGTGIKGLTGIDHQANVLRPTQSIPLDKIRGFAEQNSIIWREDVTNAEDRYLRNKIRHHVVPEIEKISSEFHDRFLDSISLLKKDAELIDDLVEDVRSRLFKKEKDFITISIASLEKIHSPNLIYHLFKPFGFLHPYEIEKLMAGRESAEITSEKYRLIKNRLILILKEIKKPSEVHYQILNLSDIHYPISLRFKKTLTEPSEISHFLDFAKIKFPLSLRVRKNGDKFYPGGMGGQSKKVSKFFKDLKLSKIEKENTWLLCDANDEIIGIPGLRWDDRFIATKDTKIWLQIEKLD